MIKSRLRNYMIARNITVNQLSDMSGLSISTIKRGMLSSMPINMYSINSICKALEVSPNELMGYVPDYDRHEPKLNPTSKDILLTDKQDDTMDKIGEIINDYYSDILSFEDATSEVAIAIKQYDKSYKIYKNTIKQAKDVSKIADISRRENDK